jgi:PII-like signaling protein
MKESKTGFLLRVLIGEDDKYKGRPLYEQIVLKARELKLSGATVFKGTMGFGADSLIHTAKILQLSEDMPIIIEIVDTEENIIKILPFLDETVEGGLVTLEKAKVIKYSASKK